MLQYPKCDYYVVVRPCYLKNGESEFPREMYLIGLKLPKQWVFALEQLAARNKIKHKGNAIHVTESIKHSIRRCVWKVQRLFV